MNFVFADIMKWNYAKNRRLSFLITIRRDSTVNRHFYSFNHSIVYVYMYVRMHAYMKFMNVWLCMMIDCVRVYFDIDADTYKNTYTHKSHECAREYVNDPYTQKHIDRHTHAHRSLNTHFTQIIFAWSSLRVTSYTFLVIFVPIFVLLFVISYVPISLLLELFPCTTTWGRLWKRKKIINKIKY